MVTKVSPFNTDEYWRALGMFVQQFSEAEREAQVLLWSMTAQDLRVATAIYKDNLDLVVVIGTLRKLYPLHVADEPSRAIFDAHMAQFEWIRDRRNKLLHNGATFTEQGAQVIQKLRGIRNPERPPPSFPMSRGELLAMGQDIDHIAALCFVLVVAQIDPTDWKVPRNWGVPDWRYPAQG